MSSTGLLTIDLVAIVSNWQLIQKKLHVIDKTTVCSAVVKADAYGLGVKPVSSKLFDAGCHHFFVASLAEGVELRQHLGFLPSISVLSGIAHGLGDEWSHYELVPVLFDISHIESWLGYCAKKMSALPCILKIDTGMHRLGMNPHALIDYLNRGIMNTWFSPIMLMSHLACAEDSRHPMNQSQLDFFEATSNKVKKYFPAIKLSLANSSACFLDSNYYFDLCRPGAALYGVNPTPSLSNPMMKVLDLELPVMQIRVIEKGDSIGYGASFVAKNNMRIAVVFGGYADGISRALSNVGYGMCGSQKVPIVGRVSMDSVVFDITALDLDPAVISILNEFQTVDDVATASGTIGYEVLTSLGARYQREYKS